MLHESGMHSLYIDHRLPPAGYRGRAGRGSGTLQIANCKLQNEVSFRGWVGLAFGGWDRKLPALQGSLKGRTWIKSDCIGKTRRRKPLVKSMASLTRTSNNSPRGSKS